jgi:hypothetical protein
MQNAFDELAGLVDGVQLTPGNHPTPRFDAYTSAKRRATSTRLHHGFDFRARKRSVWSTEARCLVDDAHSIHPPIAGSPAALAVTEKGLGAWLEEIDTPARLLETMYPGYVLGSGDEIEDAMRLGVHLAVDISHVFMQREQGSMTESTWQRLMAYERIGEVHVSANQGRHDSHQPVTRTTFGLGWARERLSAGTPVVLECYMHRLSTAERRKQIDFVDSSVG